MSYSLTVKTRNGAKSLGRTDHVKGALMAEWPALEGADSNYMAIHLRHGQLSIWVNPVGHKTSPHTEAKHETDIELLKVSLQDDQIVESLVVDIPIGYPQFLVTLCKMCYQQGFKIFDTYLDREFVLDSPAGTDLLSLLSGPDIPFS